jgi:hypothetical protein
MCKAYRHPMVVSQMRQPGRDPAPAEDRDRAVDVRLREQHWDREHAQSSRARSRAERHPAGRHQVKWEKEFRDKARTTPAAQPYLDVWDRIHELQVRKLQVQPVLSIANAGLVGSDYLVLPANIVALHRFLALPEAQRPAQLRGDRLQQFRQSLLAPVANPAVAQMRLEGQLRLAMLWLPPNYPLRTRLVQAGETPAQAAERLVRASRILDPAVREQLVGDVAAAKGSTDPMVQLALVLDSTTQALTAEAQAIAAEEQVQGSRLARALFAVYGNQLPPDATSTLRISDGIATGYEYNGSIAPYRSTFHGMYARAAEFNNVEPFNLPPKFAERKAG